MLADSGGILTSGRRQNHFGILGRRGDLGPLRVPLTVICSVILASFCGAFNQDGFGFLLGLGKPRSSSHLSTEEKEARPRMLKL
ncbi:hypothetical protein VZT92_023313 [Zoarces viviparus]|uniref:Uncharacterized protein n=1 Tax=Zoarces viviparus TaxID=48416 RepID=A0AAW1E5W6_ZOAVI